MKYKQHFNSYFVYYHAIDCCHYDRPQIRKKYISISRLQMYTLQTDANCNGEKHLSFSHEYYDSHYLGINIEAHVGWY